MTISSAREPRPASSLVASCSSLMAMSVRPRGIRYQIFPRMAWAGGWATRVSGGAGHPVHLSLPGGQAVELPLEIHAHRPPGCQFPPAALVPEALGDAQSLPEALLRRRHIGRSHV